MWLSVAMVQRGLQKDHKSGVRKWNVQEVCGSKRSLIGCFCSGHAILAILA